MARRKKKVIELLESVAPAQPSVRPNPPPMALVMGYGDSSINFEVRVWTVVTNWVQVQSALIAAIYDDAVTSAIRPPENPGRFRCHL
jgi:small-conductance mechanosensitive channel